MRLESGHQSGSETQDKRGLSPQGLPDSASPSRSQDRQCVARSGNQQGQTLLSLGKGQILSPTPLYVLLQYIAQKGLDKK